MDTTPKFNKYLKYALSLDDDDSLQGMEYLIREIYKKQFIVNRENMNYTITDAFCDTYKKIIEKKIIIIFLQFSNGYVLYISKEKIMNIPYFSNMFESINMYTICEDCIVEVKLCGKIDNFACMEQIINYVHYNHCQMSNKTFYDLMIFNNFLLDAKCVRYKHIGYLK